MAPRSRLLLVLLVSTLAACGGRTSSADDGLDEAVSASGGSAKGGTKSGGQGGRSPGGGGASSGNAGASCDSFDDEAGTRLHIQLTNETSEVLYIGDEKPTCSSTTFFAVTDQSGAALPAPGICRSPCENVRAGGPGGCPGLCASPSALVLSYGQSTELTWDGLYVSQRELPGQCVAGGAETSCDQARRIRPGAFNFSAKAGTRTDCSQTSATGVCAPSSIDGSNHSAIAGALIAGKIRTASLEVQLDPGYGVTGDAAAPSGSGPRALLPVQLVFRD